MRNRGVQENGNARCPLARGAGRVQKQRPRWLELPR
jgi:hypothetical protein